ncbi:hypothetical protein APHAL10511_006636 [Amanita phalloides]|nr:hypothetical protein APHAL10511_006636 [Amanita phalloides]
MFYIFAARTILVAVALAAFSNVYGKQPRRRSVGDLSFAPQNNSTNVVLGLSFDWTSTTSASTSQPQLIGLKRRDTTSHATLQLKRNAEDNLWVGTIQIGTPYIRDPDPRIRNPRAHQSHPQQFDISFSTISPVSWVGSCNGFRNIYIPQESSTSEFIAKPFHVTDKDKDPLEPSRAHTYSDVADVAGIKTRIEFGVVSNARGLDVSASDGIFSLSRFVHLPSEHRQHFLGSEFLAPDIMLPNSFAFNMPGNDAEIHFGRLNVPDIKYHRAKKLSHLWEMDVPGEVVVGPSTLPGYVHACVNSGTSLIYGPHDAIALLYEYLGTRAMLDPEGYYTFPCGHKFGTDVKFTWGGSGDVWKVSRNDFVYSRRDQICRGIFQGHSVLFSSNWILGQSFMKGKLIELNGVHNIIGFSEAIPLSGLK